MVTLIDQSKCTLIPDNPTVDIPLPTLVEDIRALVFQSYITFILEEKRFDLLTSQGSGIYQHYQQVWHLL